MITLTDTAGQGVVSVVRPVNLGCIIALIIAAVDQLSRVVRIEGLTKGTGEGDVGLVESQGVPVVTSNSSRGA